jgi:hypothetical protein
MSAYFAPLVILPDLITEPGDYLTRAGDIVTIAAVSRRHDYGCAGQYVTGVPDRWHKSGRLYAHTVSQNDIVAAVAA